MHDDYKEICTLSLNPKLDGKLILKSIDQRDHKSFITFHLFLDETNALGRLDAQKVRIKKIDSTYRRKEENHFQCQISLQMKIKNN